MSSAEAQLEERPAGDADVMLDVRNLETHFPVTDGMLQRRSGHVRAVDGVDLTIRYGETVGLVGESGCGKTTLGRTILRLIEPTGGQIIFKGRDLTQLSNGEMRKVRREMAMIFQDPFASLDPRQTAGEIVGEALQIHGLAPSRAARRQRIAELFEIVGLNPSFAQRYPHEFSSGQRQRIGIARALAVSPDFIICDEPISALDVSIQAQIINLLERLQDEFNLTYLFIAHDLSVVKHISDRIAVMYLGKVVEVADAQELYEDPRHPYTASLLSAIPIPDPKVERSRQQIILKGDLPSPVNPPSGCRFRTRCFNVRDRCETEVPTLATAKVGDHEAACFFPFDKTAFRRQS
jgi:oligopeptide/dipeptide ABC transporter ATP-binding protein